MADVVAAAASHKIYGIPQTINSANYVYFLAYRELFALRSHVQAQGPAARPPRLIDDTQLDRIVTGPSVRPRHFTFCVSELKCAIEELLSLHRGQGLELIWRDSLQCPTEEEYISMVNNSKCYRL